MGETLEALHRLQVVERKLAQFRLKRQEKERRVAIHARQVKKAEEQLQKNQLHSRELQIRLDAQQLDVDSREQAIDKHRQALNKAKTNKEYSAILTAMNTEKADNAKIETEILQFMEEIQGLQAEEKKVEEVKEMDLTLKFSAPVEEFVDEDMNTHGPFAEGDVATLPANLAQMLIEKHGAERVEE